MNSVDSCSWWFEGNWAHCCRQHDLDPQGLASDLALAVCAADVSSILVGVVMFLGVVLGGPFYRFIKRKRKK